METKSIQGWAAIGGFVAGFGIAFVLFYQPAGNEPPPANYQFLLNSEGSILWRCDKVTGKVHYTRAFTDGMMPLVWIPIRETSFK